MTIRIIYEQDKDSKRSYFEQLKKILHLFKLETELEQSKII